MSDYYTVSPHSSGGEVKVLKVEDVEAPVSIMVGCSAMSEDHAIFSLKSMIEAARENHEGEDMPHLVLSFWLEGEE